MALLRLRASCNGKPLSDARLARMAVDVRLGLPPMNERDPKPTWESQGEGWILWNRVFPDVAVVTGTVLGVVI